MEAQGRRSKINVVFCLILAALVLGVGFCTVELAGVALAAGPG